MISTVRENSGMFMAKNVKKGLQLKEKTLCHECKRLIPRSTSKGDEYFLEVFNVKSVPTVLSEKALVVVFC